MKPALRIGIVVAALCVVAMLVWQGITAHGAPDPTRPYTSATVAFLDIGILVFREGLECILVLAAITASMFKMRGVTVYACIWLKHRARNISDRRWRSDLD